MKKERFIVPTAEWLLIDEDGNGFSSRTGLPYTGEYTHDGYLRYRTTIKGEAKRIPAHRAVALTLLDNPLNLPTVNHINGVKDDNVVSNLEWSDWGYQQTHSVVTGYKMNAPRGEDCALSVYSEETIHEICRLLQEGYRNCEILKLMPEVKTKTISNIRMGKAWVHISKNYNYPTTRKKTFSKSTQDWVEGRILEGLSDVEISEFTKNKYITTEDIKEIRRNMK